MCYPLPLSPFFLLIFLSLLLFSSPFLLICAWLHVTFYTTFLCFFPLSHFSPPLILTSFSFPLPPYFSFNPSLLSSFYILTILLSPWPRLCLTSSFSILLSFHYFLSFSFLFLPTTLPLSPTFFLFWPCVIYFYAAFLCFQWEDVLC